MTLAAALAGARASPARPRIAPYLLHVQHMYVMYMPLTAALAGVRASARTRASRPTYSTYNTCTYRTCP